MRKFLFLLGSACLASPLAAQDDDTGITVTATGARGNVTDTGQSVTVIGEDEIDAVQGADIARVLRRAPGVTITRNGPPGSFTGVRVRGAAAELGDVQRLLLWQPHSAGWQLQLLAPGAATGQQLWQLPASAEAPLLLGAALDGQWAVVEQNEAFWLLRAGVAEQHQSLAAEQLLVDEQQRLLQLEGDTLLLDRLTASGTERLYRRRLPVAEQSILAALPGSEQLLLAHVDAGQDAWVVTLYDHQLGTVLGSGVLADLSPFELPQAQVSDDGSRVYLALGDERWLEIDPQRLRPDALVPADADHGEMVAYTQGLMDLGASLCGDSDSVV